MHVSPACQRVQMVRWRWLRLGLILACAIALSGPSRAAAADDSARLFSQYCTQCHGADGRGGPGRTTMPVIPDFTSSSWHKTRTNAQLAYSVMNGKNLQMPSNQGRLTDAQARALVKYIRTFNPAAVTKSAPVKRPTGGVSSGSATTGGGASGWTGTGDFDADFDNLEKEMANLQRQMRELSSPRAAGSAPPGKTASENTSPGDTSPGNAPPVATSPGSPAATKPAAPAARPIGDLSFTADDVDRGRQLFAGRTRLANGGTSCINCHAAYGSGGPEAGRLGSDLTKVYERLGGREALRARLMDATTPPLHATYLQHPLEPDEVLSLVAYLEDADRKGAEQPPAFPLKLFLFGLGGSVLALTFITALGRGRFRPRRNPPLANGRLTEAPLPERVPAAADHDWDGDEAAEPASSEAVEEGAEDAIAIGL